MSNSWRLVLRNEKIYGLKYEIDWIISGICKYNWINLGPCLVNAITFTNVICKWHTIPSTKCFYTYECLTKSHSPLHARQSTHKGNFSLDLWILEHRTNLPLLSTVGSNCSWLACKKASYADGWEPQIISSISQDMRVPCFCHLFYTNCF